ncbi:alkaline phosphatase family protein [Haloferacaceae archaeon DSL9]
MNTHNGNADTKLDVLLIGIDAGNLPVFERLFEEDRLPNIEAICSDGVAAPLESQIPPWTPSAWPSIYTGVNPGKHGAVGFVGYDGYDWHVTNRQDVQEHALWSLLEQHDLSSVIVNVPVTHPPDEFDGVLIPGFMSPENPDCRPEGVLDEVRDAIGEYRIYPNYTRDQTVADAEKIEEYLRLIEMRGEAFAYLADAYDPDFGFVQFQKTDTVFHEFDGDPEKVATVHEAADEQIGRIIEECDPESVFIVSDHGMGEYGEYEFRVNDFLRDEGYVKTTTGGKGMPSWTPMRKKLQNGEKEDVWEPGKLERMAGFLAEYGVTAAKVRTALETVGLGELATKYAPGNISRTANEQVDFENSTAYMRARTEIGVRINLEGREPNGTVSEAEYERVRDELIEKLEAVKAPDGQPVFEEVTPRETYFHGKHLDKTVDIVTVPRDFDVFLSEQLRGEYFGRAEPWNHKLDGIFAAAGEGIDRAADLDGAHIFDVAPTIMAALGVPYSDRMDGRVLPVVEPTDAMAYPEYDADEGSADREGLDETDEVEERLADLGYLN